MTKIKVTIEVILFKFILNKLIADFLQKIIYIQIHRFMTYHFNTIFSSVSTLARRHSESNFIAGLLKN